MPVFEIKVSGTVEVGGVLTVIANTHEEAKLVAVRDLSTKQLEMKVKRWPDGLDIVKVTRKRLP